MNPNHPCPCGSGTKLKRCCRPFHRGAVPPTAEALMRSRYTAYALGEVDYILETTHPESPQADRDRDAWRRGVEEFASSASFAGLDVRERETDGDLAWVTFHVTCQVQGRDRSFTERSEFRRVEGRWLYYDPAPSRSG